MCAGLFNVCTRSFVTWCGGNMTQIVSMVRAPWKGQYAVPWPSWPKFGRKTVFECVCVCGQDWCSRSPFSTAMTWSKQSGKGWIQDSSAGLEPKMNEFHSKGYTFTLSCKKKSKRNSEFLYTVFIDRKQTHSGLAKDWFEAGISCLVTVKVRVREIGSHVGQCASSQVYKNTVCECVVVSS